MSEEEIAEIEARCNSASPAPWWHYHKSVAKEGVDSEDGFICCFINESNERNSDNMEFIAHAREDIPKLIAALKAASACTEMEKK